MIRLIRMACLYFGAVFSAGFVLGAVRVLVVAEHLGERYAELAELPLMLLVCGVAAHYLTRSYASSLSPGRAVLVGMLSLALLLAVEFSVVLAIRGLSIADYLAARDPLAGAAYIIGLIWYAAAPAVCHWRLTRQAPPPR